VVEDQRRSQPTQCSWPLPNAALAARAVVTQLDDAIYGEEIRPGEPHVIWRRAGTHDLFRQP